MDDLLAFTVGCKMHCFLTKAVLAQNIRTKMTIQGLIIWLLFTSACQTLPLGNNNSDKQIQTIDRWQQRFNQARANALNNIQIQNGSFNQVEIERCIKKARQEYRDAMATP